MSMGDNSQLVRKRVRITGAVQGVGFRPYVSRLAARLQLSGWIRNECGVTLEIEGDSFRVESFLETLKQNPPTHSLIASFDVSDVLPISDVGFKIVASEPGVGAWLPVDIAPCDSCMAEMFDPDNRRYRHPFISCTSCGPRYSIVRELPFDREHTSQSDFQMCADCQAEYERPSDRRFHAQTQACMQCGPTLTFANAQAEVIAGDAIRLAAGIIRNQGILALKSVGGFLLVCDATQIETVKRLRNIKRRPDKPLALMTANIKTVSAYSDVSPSAARMLADPGRPIVLLGKKKGQGIAWSEAVAGTLDALGWMLPSSSIHHLLLHELDGCPDFQKYQHEVSASVLVATSANISGDVLVADYDEAVALFAGVVDGFLFHDREIVHRSDDSVMRLHQEQESWLRRARSYAPAPMTLFENNPSVIALGADLKSTLCFTKGHQAFLSPHIGDLENLNANRLADESYHSLSRLLDICPEAIACDLHPDFHSTRLAAAYAAKLGVPLIQVQHHHAHIESVLAEHHLDCPVIGLVLDGYGFGPDGTVWGGECLRVAGGEYQRLGRLRPVAMPGGDMVVHEPWRMAASFLSSSGDDCTGLIAKLFPEQEEVDAVIRLCRSEFSMQTSSAGRLLDAAQAIVTGMDHVTYEGQAAIEFESLAGGEMVNECYPYQLNVSGDLLELDVSRVFSALAAGKLGGVEASILSRRFYASFIAGLVNLIEACAAQANIGHVVLAGGCFANALLATIIDDRLKSGGIQVWRSKHLPAGDGGISLGQARVAQLLLKQQRGD